MVAQRMSTSPDGEPRSAAIESVALPALRSPASIHWRWMVGSALVAALLIFGIYGSRAARFTATAQIAFDAGDRIIPVERLEAFIAAPERIGRTVDRLGLVASTEKLIPSARQQAIDHVWAGLRVEQTDLTNVFLLRFTDGSRRLAAPIVNDLADRIGAASAISPTIHARIVSSATDPIRPDGSLLAPVLMALLSGAFAAVVMLALREWRQEGPRSPATVERQLGLKVIGMIPVVPFIPTGERAALIELPITAPQSDYARAFRQLLASDRRISGTIAICSALAGEGKSTFAISLARTAALEGHRVALVDCDGRVRTASKTLGLAGRQGLIQVMDGLTPLDDALATDTHSSLKILAHSADADVRNFWSKDAMGQLRDVIAALRGTYDLVILDTPPLLALVEAREIAGLADEALLIGRWRATPIPALRLAARQLADKSVRSSLVLSFVTFARSEAPAGRSVPALRASSRPAVATS
jgi:Mrp family chromosome partitioning ATPase